VGMVRREFPLAWYDPPIAKRSRNKYRHHLRIFFN
jgi:hypothetical protein